MVWRHHHFSGHYRIDSAFRRLWRNFAPVGEVSIARKHRGAGRHSLCTRDVRLSRILTQNATPRCRTPNCNAIFQVYSFATKKNLHVFCYRCSTLPLSVRRSEEPFIRLGIAIIVLVPLSFSLPVLAETPLPALGVENNPLWLRYPAISPDGKTIAFSFRGHIFTVPAAGGLAVRSDCRAGA